MAKINEPAYPSETVPAAQTARPTGFEAPPRQAAAAEPARPVPPPPPAAAPRPVPTQRHAALAEHLERTRRHPVIVFGIGASGKTTLLMSLVQAINRSNQVNIFLGESIFPKEHPDAADTFAQAQRFFERDAQAFALGNLVPPTKFEKPYFIPLDIVRKSDGRKVRVALLEGRGEWYLPEREGTGSMFKKFQTDLADIMELYGESLTVLWVAPYMKENEDEISLEDSDLGLQGALIEYSNLRGPIGQDFHLFLFNKWDCFAEPLDDDPRFSVVGASKVESLIEEGYPNIWPNYQGLAGTAGRLFFMQYSSGHIVKDRVRVPPKRHRAAFDRYPRTVWNWIWGNATETELNDDGVRARDTLFPDVLTRRFSFAEWISRVLLSR